LALQALAEVILTGATPEAHSKAVAVLVSLALKFIYYFATLLMKREGAFLVAISGLIGGSVSLNWFYVALKKYRPGKLAQGATYQI
jgi:hypothetical protein